MRRTTMSRAALLGTTLLANLMLAGGALAQSPPTSVEEIVVTGTRIPRPNLDLPTPVSVLTTANIENAGPQNLGDVISLMPAVGFSGTVRANSNNFTNGAGVSSIDLRTLGLARTLVLVDGQRHVAGDITTNAVDISSIPPALVDRVEVITGGASAIYGSDAVTGVVNIILKKSFEGIEAQAEYGGFDAGYGGKYSASVTGGKTFLEGRLNVAVTGFYSKERGIEANQLPSAHNYGTISNPNDLPPGTFDPTFYSSGSPIKKNGIPDTIYVPNVGSDLVTPNGVLLNANTFDPQFSFDRAGHLVPIPTRTGYNSFAFAQLPANCQDCYFADDFTQLASPIEAKGVSVNAHMDFTAHLHGFVDAKFVQTDTTNTIQPSFSFGDFQLQPDNAFITPELRTALAGTDPADYPFIAKFLNAGRTEEARRRTYRVVTGLTGDFDGRFAKINWDASINYGETDSRFVNNSLEITQNFQAALDSVIDPATGKAACRINVPSAPQTGNGSGAFHASSCLPYNPFGIQNSAATLAYSFGAFATTDKLTQQVASLNANFDTRRFFNLQGGPVGVAVGAEYRMERTSEVNDPFLVAGNTENLASNSSGGYNVYEGYGEVSLPIFKNYGPFVDELTIDGAYRSAHYSTVGNVDAYKISGAYAPVHWLKLQSTYSQAIRAPNITEAFLPSSSTFFNITDPCSTENIQSNVNYAKNCAAAGLPAGFIANTNASITGVTSGNRDLSPERSVSYTGGFLLQPPIVPNLIIRLDYYSIKIKDAISNVQAQDVINNCFGSSAGLDQNFCTLLTRGADKNINFVKTTYVNASKLFTDGYELQVNYHTGVSGLTDRWTYTRPLNGDLAVDLSADYVAHLRNFPFQNNPAQVHILEGVKSGVEGNTNVGTPQVKALLGLTYRQGPVSVTWQARYLGRGALFVRDSTSADHSEGSNIPYAEATVFHNIAATYRFGGRLDGLELTGGVNDLFDEQPPFTLIGTGNDVAYDLGRFAFVGMKFRR